MDYCILGQVYNELVNREGKETMDSYEYEEDMLQVCKFCLHECFILVDSPHECQAFIDAREESHELHDLYEDVMNGFDIDNGFMSIEEYDQMVETEQLEA